MLLSLTQPRKDVVYGAGARGGEGGSSSGGFRCERKGKKERKTPTKPKEQRDCKGRREGFNSKRLSAVKRGGTE